VGHVVVIGWCDHDGVAFAGRERDVRVDDVGRARHAEQRQVLRCRTGGALRRLTD